MIVHRVSLSNVRTGEREGRVRKTKGEDNNDVATEARAMKKMDGASASGGGLKWAFFPVGFRFPVEDHMGKDGTAPFLSQHPTLHFLTDFIFVVKFTVAT